MFKAIGLLLAWIAAIVVFAQDPMTNESVMKMVKGGVSEHIIVEAIKQNPGNYALSPDALISLKASGVPDAVISAMMAKAKASANTPAESSVPVRQPAAGGACKRMEVLRFDVAPKVKNFDNDHVSALMGDIVTQLSRSQVFEAVLPQGQRVVDQAPPCMQLAGTVVKYSKGSRALRYAGGPIALAGPGKTTVKAHIKFINAATGAVIHEQDVDGKVWIGLFGGASDGADRGLGKEVAKVASKRLM